MKLKLWGKKIGCCLITASLLSGIFTGFTANADEPGERSVLRTDFSAYQPSVEVKFYNEYRENKCNSLSLCYQVKNVGETNLNLKNLELRYYFTNDGSMPLKYQCNYANIGTDCYLGNFVKVDDSFESDEYYLKSAFTEYADVLKAGESVEFKVSITKGTGEVFIQGNDYSFNSTSAEYVEWNKVTAYYGGALIWGNEVSEYSAPSENLALHKFVNASSNNSGQKAGEELSVWNIDNLVNGERRSLDGFSNGWQSNEENQSWFSVDLGEINTINRVDLYAINWLSDNRSKDGIVGEGFPVDFSIQLSSNNSDWITVYNVENYLRPTSACNVFKFSSQKARFIKVVSTKNRKMSNNQYRMALAEIEVYQDKSIVDNADITIPSDGREIVYPTEYSGAMQNPLMGMAEKDFRVNTNNEACRYDWPLDYMPWSSLAMTYIPWNVLEDDVDDTIEKIAEYCDERWRGKDSNGVWHSYEDYNIKVIPRVYLKFPDDSFWGLEGNHWPKDMASNNFTSSEFDKRLKRFIQRLGALWDNDPRVAYIQMGIYGLWGEQHGTGVPANIGEYFHQYFPNKKVEVRYTDGWDEFSFGQYNDSIGDMRTISNWKKQEVGGETAYDYNGLTLTGKCPHETMFNLANSNNVANMIRKTHAIYTTWVGEYTYREETEHMGVDYYYSNKTAMDRGAEIIQKAFGYRYVVTEFNYPKELTPGERFAVQFKVKNNGASPMYYNWPVQLSLLDPDTNEVVWKDNFKDVDIREWLPGEGYENWNGRTNGNWSEGVLAYQTEPKLYTVKGMFSIPETIKTGKDYIIQLAIVDPAGNMPSLKFAINNYKNGGYHPMGYVGVGQKPENSQLDESYFDCPAKDISLRYYSVNSSVKAASKIESVDISGSSPVAVIDGAAYNLDQIVVKAQDQFNSAKNMMAGIPIEWEIDEGDSLATITENTLVGAEVGKGALLAKVNGIKSNKMEFYVNSTANSGVVEGRVEDESGNGISNAALTLMADQKEYRAVTDKNGHYYISEVPEGKQYTLNVSKAGYQQTVSLGVAVQTGHATSVNTIMQHSIEGLGSISGLVTNNQQNAIEGVTVLLTGNGTSYTAETDQSGSYYFHKIPVGSNYVLSATTEDYEEIIKYDISVTSGDVTVVNLTMSAMSGSVEGFVKDSLGKILNGVTVKVIVSGIEYTATTDKSGFYSIQKVPQGMGYVLTAALEGYEEQFIENIMVTGAEVTVFDFIMNIESAGHFADDFSDGGVNWTPGTYGTWKVIDGEYCQTQDSTSSTNWKMSTAITGKVWYDATYEVDLKSVSNAGWGAFMFRKQNQNDNASNTGYFAYLSNTGKVVLAKAGKNVTVLASVEPDYALDMTEYHHLKIVTLADNIKIYIDHAKNPVIDLNDSSYMFGYAGLGAGGNRWNFDNVCITENFIDDFSDGTVQWKAGTYGIWKTQEGAYCQTQVSSSASNWKMSTAIAGKLWKDATYEVDLKSVSNTGWGAFMFRKTNQDDNESNTGYFVYVTNTGTVVLAKAGKNVEHLADVIPDNEIDMTKYHHLKIVTKETNIKVYLDSAVTPIIDMDDSTYLSGYAGLGAGGSKWCFDNVIVVK